MDVVQVNHLTKIYKLFPSPKARIKEAIHPFGRKYHSDFYALNDISFTIAQGETYGIIGRNGSGKSTLLKILTGVLTQTSGDFEVAGKIASLLELGAGFNPELTGMENIYFNGTIMGFSRAEMAENIEAILKFADIGEYINQPVKTYSSGMFVRLAFSVAINVEPDILIIDEALSVGDIAFQMKCFDKFKKFRQAGKTIVFVTHSLESILRYCNRCMVLDRGKMICDSSPKEAVDIYKRIMVGQYDEKSPAKEKVKKSNMDESINEEHLRYGDGKAQISQCKLLDSEGSIVNKLLNDKMFQIQFQVCFTRDIANPIFAYTIKDMSGLEITGTNTEMEQLLVPFAEKDDEFTVTFEQTMNLRNGNYALSLGCVSMQDGVLTVHDRLYDILLFEVIGSKSFVGLFDLKTKMDVKKRA